jgi:hypothetical protein
MNRNPHLTILISYMLVILSACTALVLVSFKSKSHRLFKVPAIINNKKGAPVCLAPNFMMAADHSIERIERFDDTLDLAKQPKWSKEKYYTVNGTSEPEDYFNDGGIKVIVDTQHEIGVSVRPGMPAVQGFPVYIANQAKHATAKIETINCKLNMVVEAYTSKNTWEPIEYVPTAGKEQQCDRVLSLPPQHYAFTSNIIHCGDHITRCRVKLTNGENVYYSNIFWMGINYTQFEKS